MLNSIKRLFGFGRRKPAVSADALGLMQDRYAKLKATYDAARTTDEFRNYWANADSFDADSANSRDVRELLRERSRYEAANNAYADGIAQTITNDLVGVGPSLRMQTASSGFNQMVELSWHLWSEAVNLRQKLWCMAHAKHVDGEAFAIIRRNPNVSHPIQLDLVLYETDQCQSPYMWLPRPGSIDGIDFDRFGNPTWYYFLREHPGSTHVTGIDREPERVAADTVLHWYRLRRPGQHRGVPEMVSSLNAGAAARRWREATLSAAERAALLTMMMRTEMTPEDVAAVAPFTSMDIEKGLMTFLPRGWSPEQMEGKFPTASHEMFHKQLINEMGRSVNMPRNKAAADSSDYNYASGRLDHGTYYDSLDVQRQDCGLRVLSPLFNTWLNVAISRFGWLGGNFAAVGSVARLHIWDWPKHRVADVEAEASANQTKLKSGQVTLSRLYSDAGEDFEDEVEQMAQDFGLTVDEMRRRLLDVIMPVQNQPAAPAAASPLNDSDVVDALYHKIIRRGDLNGRINGNGAKHG